MTDFISKKIKIINQLIKFKKIMEAIKVKINGKVVIKSYNNEDRFINNMMINS